MRFKIPQRSLIFSPLALECQEERERNEQVGDNRENRDGEVEDRSSSF